MNNTEIMQILTLGAQIPLSLRHHLSYCFLGHYWTAQNVNDDSFTTLYMYYACSNF